MLLTQLLQAAEILVDESAGCRHCFGLSITALPRSNAISGLRTSFGSSWEMLVSYGR